jgi:hypothetical protein
MANINIDPSISLAIKPPPTMTLPELLNFATSAQQLQRTRELIPLELEQQKQVTRTGSINLGVLETTEEERRRVARFFANPENFQTDGVLDMKKINSVLPTIAPLTGRQYMAEMTQLGTAQTTGNKAKTELDTNIRNIIGSRLSVLGRVNITDKEAYLKELDLLAEQYPNNSSVQTLVNSYKTQFKNMPAENKNLPQYAIREAESLLSPEQQQAAFAPKAATVSLGGTVQPVISQPSVGGRPPSIEASGQGMAMSLAPQPAQVNVGPEGAPVIFDPNRGILSAPSYGGEYVPPSAAPFAAPSAPSLTVPPGAPSAAPSAAPRGVTAQDMTATPAGFPLSFPVRPAGSIRPMAPGEQDARQLGQRVRSSLLEAQRDVPKANRAVGEIIRVADTIAQDVRYQTGTLADVERAIRTNLGGDQRYKELAKDIAQVQIAINKANGASTDQQTAQVAAGTGDATYPPDVLIKISRRLRGELTEIDARAQAAQAFQRRFGDANLADFQQAWTQNSDLRNFEVMAIMRDIRDPRAQKAALDKILPTSPDELRDLQQKYEAIEKLIRTGTLR